MAKVRRENYEILRKLVLLVDVIQWQSSPRIHTKIQSFSRMGSCWAKRNHFLFTSVEHEKKRDELAVKEENSKTASMAKLIEKHGVRPSPV